jgi:hypothetical protein
MRPVRCIFDYRSPPTFCELALILLQHGSPAARAEARDGFAPVEAAPLLHTTKAPESAAQENPK